MKSAATTAKAAAAAATRRSMERVMVMNISLPSLSPCYADAPEIMTVFRAEIRSKEQWTVQRHM